jgi:mercuric ion binding protein
MRRLFAIVWAAIAVSAAGVGVAAERTVTLRVENMSCVTCPYIVKSVLADVEGVTTVDVSYEAKTAVVTFDDARATVEALTAATAMVGFPSSPIN